MTAKSTWQHARACNHSLAVIDSLDTFVILRHFYGPAAKRAKTEVIGSDLPKVRKCDDDQYMIHRRKLVPISVRAGVATRVQPRNGFSKCSATRIT